MASVMAAARVNGPLSSFSSLERLSIFSGSAFKYAELVEVSISVTVMSSDLLSSVLIL